MSMNSIREEAKRHEILAHEYRLVIVKTLSVQGALTWTSIVQELEKYAGKRMNPNSINFHLSRLIEAGYVNKMEKDGEQVYVLTDGANSIVADRK